MTSHDHVNWGIKLAEAIGENHERIEGSVEKVNNKHIFMGDKIC